MKLKLLTIAAFSIMLAGGSALAQDSSASDTTNAENAPKYLTDPAKMGAFYTDDTMTTMRSADEINTAFMAMSEEDRTAMMKECETTDSIKYKDFCGALPKM